MVLYDQVGVRMEYQMNKEQIIVSFHKVSTGTIQASNTSLYHTIPVSKHHKQAEFQHILKQILLNTAQKSKVPEILSSKYEKYGSWTSTFHTS